jgi:hypothetical protein
VEIFLVKNKEIGDHNEEHSYHMGSERRKTPVFVLDGMHSIIKLSVFSSSDPRASVKGRSSLSQRAATKVV